jgi:NAD(P)H-dependent flavin oxidoreductase YrpB (nitropropane dioxygenase family)
MFNFSKLGVPIIQAPMAGGTNNPLLASEVSNAGGVGSFGFSYSTPQKISEEMALSLPTSSCLAQSICHLKRFKRKPLKH